MTYQQDQDDRQRRRWRDSSAPVRRFPTPWSIDERSEAFTVRDAAALGYFYFEDKPRRQMSMHRLTRDEAKRMALNFTNLAELIRRSLEPRKESVATICECVAEVQSLLLDRR